MRFIVHNETEPAFNLAMEEYLLTQTDWELIMLWRNRKSVIIGNNQNAWEEINPDYTEKHGIPVVRRLSGGGAVFHDLGNINYSVIHRLGKDDFCNYEKFTSPICAFLKTLGIEARLGGRNDLLIGERKFSGNAQTVKKGRIMHHGTLLYDTDFGDLAGALKPRDIKITGKSIPSVRARVTNLRPHLSPPLSVEAFLEQLSGFFLTEAADIEAYCLTEEDMAAARRLAAEKYATWDWNYGKSPAYSYENAVKLPFGLVELKLNAIGGVIQDIGIYGDYFGIRDRSELENRLIGVRHEREAVRHALEELDIEAFIFGMAKEEFVSLF